MSDIDPRAERDLDDHLRVLAQATAPLPPTTRTSVKQRVLAAVDASATADTVATAAATAGTHAVEPDAPARRRRRWLAAGALAAAAAALGFGLWAGIERDPSGLPHSRPEVRGGQVGGSVPRTAPPPAPKAVPHTVQPQNISPAMLEDDRIAGNKSILPDEGTFAALAAAGKNRLVMSEKLCVDKHGDVYSINILKSSGYPAYDAKVAIEISQWKYKPRDIDVCTAVTFIASQR